MFSLPLLSSPQRHIISLLIVIPPGQTRPNPTAQSARQCARFAIGTDQSVMRQGLVVQMVLQFQLFLLFEQVGGTIAWMEKKNNAMRN